MGLGVTDGLVSLVARGGMAARSVRSAVSSGRAVSVGLLNQGVASATTFSLLFVLVRLLSPADYGAYVMGVALCHIVNGLGNDLFLTQMVVHLPEKPVRERMAYAGRMLVAVATSCVLIIILGAVTGVVAAQLNPKSRAAIGFSAAVAFAAAAYLSKDYFVRLAYALRAERRALLVTCCVAVVLVASLAGIRAAGWALSTESALLLFGGAHFVGALSGLFWLRVPLRGLRVRRVLDDVAECWVHGRWAVGASSLWWVQAQAYTFLTALIIGAAGVARVNASRLLVAPIMLLIPAINQVTVPRLARLRVTDPSRVVTVGTRITKAVVCCAAVYSIVLLAALRSVMPAMLGSQYVGVGSLVAAWCGALIVLVLRDGATTMLQSLKQFRSLAAPNAVCAIIAVGIQLVLLRTVGIIGAIIGAACGDLLLAVMLWRVVFFYRETLPLALGRSNQG